MSDAAILIALARVWRYGDGFKQVIRMAGQDDDTIVRPTISQERGPGEAIPSLEEGKPHN
jgi:hypothetical protein